MKKWTITLFTFVVMLNIGIAYTVGSSGYLNRMPTTAEEMQSRVFEMLIRKGIYFIIAELIVILLYSVINKSKLKQSIKGVIIMAAIILTLGIISFITGISSTPVVW